MPTNKNAFLRYWYLDPLLADQYRYYDIHDLTEKVNACLRAEDRVEVDERTIQKDLQELEFAPFNAPLARPRIHSKRCIRYADPTYSLFKKKLTDDEEILLKELLNTLGQFEGLDSLSWFDDLKHRLKLKEDWRDVIIRFDTNPRTTDSSLLGRLFEAIAHKQVIRVCYYTFKEADKEKTVVIHPYLLKQYNTRWYVFGASNESGFLLQFALDRIIRFEPEPTVPFKECEFDFIDRFEDIVGVTLSRNDVTHEVLPCENIILWAEEQEIGYLETKPIHGSQTAVVGNEEENLRQRYPHLSGGRFYRLQCIPNRELYQVLMAYFSDIELLEPLSMRNEFAAIISRMNRRYR